MITNKFFVLVLTYGKTSTVWDEKTASKHLFIGDNGIIKHIDKEYWKCVHLLDQIDHYTGNGLHHWKIKIIKHIDNQVGRHSMVFGISKEENILTIMCHCTLLKPK